MSARPHAHGEKERDTYIHIRPSKHPSTPAHVRTHAWNQKKRDKDRFKGKGKDKKKRNSKIDILQNTLTKVRT